MARETGKDIHGTYKSASWTAFGSDIVHITGIIGRFLPQMNCYGKQRLIRNRGDDSELELGITW